MKGLLCKDLYLLRQYAKSVLIFLVLFTLPAFFGKSGIAAGIITGPMLILFMLMSITSISYDKQAGWDKYALSMPISRETLVLEKYLLTLVLAAIGTLLSLAYNAIAALVQHTINGAAASSLWEILLTHWFVFGLGLVFTAVTLPLIYQFGPEKGRLFLLVFYALPMVLLMALQGAEIAVPFSEAAILRAFGLLPVAALALFAFSYYISLSIFKKKEF